MSWMVCEADFEDWVARRYEVTRATQMRAGRHPDASPNAWLVGEQARAAVGARWSSTRGRASSE